MSVGAPRGVRDISSATATLIGQTIGFGAGKLAKNHWICFVEGTQVAARGDGGELTSTSIEEIEVGDYVWSRNEFTGEEGFKPVVQVFRNETRELAHLTYTVNGHAGATQESPAVTQTLTGTPEHPFWSLTRQGWICMGELRIGEALLLGGPGAASTATVTSCRVEKLAKPVAVYNFEVADWHTYHVGNEHGWVWVHNRCGPGTRAPDTAHMSKAARRFQGTTTDVRVPWKAKPTPTSRSFVKFDKWDDAAGELVDRKLSITFFKKSMNQAERQAKVAAQHGVGVRWEVPPDQIGRAKTLLAKVFGEKSSPIRLIARKKR